MSTLKTFTMLSATAVVSAAITLTAVTLLRDDAPVGSGAIPMPANAADATRDDAVALQLRTLQDRLARLENERGGPAITASEEIDMERRRAQDRAPLTERQIADRRATSLAGLQAALMSEPAANAVTQPLMDDILASGFGDELGIAPPTSHEATCRGRMCRLAVRYDDEGAAADAATALTMEFGEVMPNARAFVAPRPDGGYEAIVYATTEEGRALLAGPPST